MVDFLDLNPLASTTAAEGWEYPILSNAFPWTYGFGNQLSQSLELQEVQSYAAPVLSLQTNFDLHQYDSGVGSANAVKSPESPMQIRRRSKRAVGATSNGTHSRSDSSPSVEALVAFDRSERARKAANRRHYKGKETAPQSDSRRTKSDNDREKNRIAAAKCRKKEQVATEALDAKYSAVMADNSRMMREHRDLRDQLVRWRVLALQHVSGLNGCQCNAIQRYNKNQAMKAIRNMDNGTSRSFSLSPSSPGAAFVTFDSTLAGA